MFGDDRESSQRFKKILIACLLGSFIVMVLGSIAFATGSFDHFPYDWF